MNFEQWYRSSSSLSWLEYRTKTGLVQVYVRKCVAERKVVEVANIYTRQGWGAAPHFYRRALADIPAVSEFVINPELGSLLMRWGWQEIPVVDAPAPSLVNPAFLRLYGTPPPCISNSHGVRLAVDAARACDA